MCSTNQASRTETGTFSLAHSRCVATDHSGMSLRTQFQPEITIVEVHGAVDACNADRLRDYVEDLASGRPLVVDLSVVDFFGGDGFRALVRIAETCQRTAARWALVTSAAVDRLLRIVDSNYLLPTTASPEEAMQRLLTPHDHGWSLPQCVTPLGAARC